MTIINRKRFFIAAAALMLLGVGCARDKKEPTNVNVPLVIGPNQVAIALILTENASAPAGVETNEKIGCNDTLAFKAVEKTTKTDDDIRNALNALFSIKESNVDGLYNALAYSQLTIDKIQSRDGVSTEVWFKGKISSGGVCDDPRIKAQIEGTIRRIKPNFKVFLNGNPGI